LDFIAAFGFVEDFRFAEIFAVVVFFFRFIWGSLRLHRNVVPGSLRRYGCRVKKAAQEAPAAVDPRFAPVVAAFAKDRLVTTGGKGFGSTGLKVNGKLFAMIASKGKFVVKLPKARVAELVDGRKGEFFDPGHGRLMKEWIALDVAPHAWVALAQEARRFVGAAGRAK
jgi:hypothetical protein